MIFIRLLFLLQNLVDGFILLQPSIILGCFLS